MRARLLNSSDHCAHLQLVLIKELRRTRPQESFRPRLARTRSCRFRRPLHGTAAEERQRCADKIDLKTSNDGYSHNKRQRLIRRSPGEQSDDPALFQCAHRRPDPGRPTARSTAPTWPSACRARAISKCSTRCIDVRDRFKLINARHEAGAANMAEAYGKLTGKPGICHGHARPRRLPRVGRRAHRVPGFDADDPADRPGRPRHDGPRGVPGDRLPPDVRPGRQMGGADRRHRARFPNISRAPSTSRPRAGPARWCWRCPRTC